MLTLRFLIVLETLITFSRAFQVVEKMISHPDGVDIGEKVTLKCKSTEW